MSNLFFQFAAHIDDEFIQALKEPDQLIDKGKVFKNDKSTTVVKIEFHGKSYIIKRFNARDFGHKIKRALRETRAKCCWEMSRKFESVGLNVAKPIAMIEKQYGVFKGDSYFVSEFIQGEELLAWLPKQESRVISQVTQQLQDLFDVFYRNRLSHGDMKATNLLWSQGKIFLIDLDVARKHFFQVMFKRANLRDRRRFCRNGDLFRTILRTDKVN